MTTNPKNRMKSIKQGMTCFSISSELFHKAKSIFSAALLVSVMMACNSSDKNKTTTEDLKRQANEAIKTSKDYGSERWDDLNGNIHEFERNLEVTTKEAELMFRNLSSELQKQYEGQKEKLAEKKAELDQTFKEYQKATGEKRQELESEVLRLKAALYESISTFEEEMRKSKKRDLTN
jgi:dsDNA-specific endonuclease/ATPase MutS2